MSAQNLGLFVNVVSALAVPVAIYKTKILNLPEGVRVILATIAAVVIVLIVVYSIWDFFWNVDNGKKRYKNSEDVKEAMIDIIKKDGNTIILSRNMSWAEDDEVVKALSGKSKSGDLKIYLQSNGPKVERLSNYQTSVKNYGDDFTPTCRFTINKAGGHGESIYIAAPDTNEHVIYHYSDKDGPIFHLAKDLIELLKLK
jgi:hypothetical protein